MIVNGAAVAAVLLYGMWQALAIRGGSLPETPFKRQLANFLYLWATNAAGAAELVLVNSFLGPPTTDERDPTNPYSYDEDGNKDGGNNPDALAQHM